MKTRDIERMLAQAKPSDYVEQGIATLVDTLDLAYRVEYDDESGMSESACQAVWNLITVLDNDLGIDISSYLDDRF